MDFLKNLNPLDTLTNLFNKGYNIYQDQRNYKYQKDLQEELFKRDDNAMQRRMADYEKSGINPLFAISGSAAGNSSAGGVSGSMLSLDNSFYSSQAQKKLEREALKQEADKRKIEMEQMRIQLRSGKIANWQALQDLNTKRLEQDILKKQIEQMETTGIYPLSGFGKSTVDFTNLVLPMLQNFFEGFQYTLNRHPEIQKITQSLNDPSKIPELTNKIKQKSQEIANYLGNPIISRNKNYVSEYEARVLRHSSDKNRKDSAIYGFSHRSNISQKYNQKKKF